MKILCGPDLHCFWNTYEKNRVGIPDRYREWLIATSEMVSIAIRAGVQMAIFPGDLFIESRPSPRAVHAIIELFGRMEKDYHIKVIAIGGNHDDIGPGEVDFVDVLRSYSHFWGITSLTRIECFDDLSITVVPYMKPSEIGSGTTKDISRKLWRAIDTRVESEDSEEDESRPRKDRILVAHYGTEISTYANGSHPDTLREVYLPFAELKESDYKAVILGHIHKPQLLNEDPLIFHTGIVTRGKSDEGNVPCGCWILDTDNWSCEFFELKSARMITTVKLSTEAMQSFSDGNWLDEIPDVSDHIVKVSYTVPEESLSAISIGDITHALYTKGAYFVEGIYPTVIRKERKRNVMLNERTDEKEAFIRWYRSAGEPPELEEAAATLFAEYLEEAQNG